MECKLYTMYYQAILLKKYPLSLVQLGIIVSSSLLLFFSHYLHFRNKIGNSNIEISNLTRQDIAADEVEWDYTPLGYNAISGNNFTGDTELLYTKKTDTTIGSKYLKSVYHQYTDSTFTVQVWKLYCVYSTKFIIQLIVGAQSRQHPHGLDWTSYQSCGW